MQIFLDKIKKPRNRKPRNGKPRNGKPRKTRDYCSNSIPAIFLEKTKYSSVIINTTFKNSNAELLCDFLESNFGSFFEYL